jgi:RimJ/RimL family protein N-acetyltransferase
LIDPRFHGKKLGVELLKRGIAQLIKENENIHSVFGYVMSENIASIKTFEKLSFDNVNSENNLLKFKKQITNENC